MRLSILRKFKSIDDLQKEYLDEQTAILEYFWGNGATICLCNFKNSQECIRIKNSEKILEDLSFIRKVVGNAPNKNSFNEEAIQFNRISHSLYKRLIQPFASSLQDISEIIIIPDAQLNYLPFEILLGKRGWFDWRLSAQ